MNIFESWLDKPIIAGYSISSFAWYLDIFIILGIVLVIGGFYFLFVWLFGRLKMNKEQKQQVKDYKALDKASKKRVFKESKGPVKNLLVWRKMKPWFIPVVSVICVVSLVAVPVLTVAGEQLLVTLSGSHVTVYDTEASKQAAAEAKENVVSIEEEGIVMLKNENDTLPLNLEDNNNENILENNEFKATKRNRTIYS